MNRNRELLWEQTIPDGGDLAIPILATADGALVGVNNFATWNLTIEIKRRKRDKFATLKVWTRPKASKAI